MVGGSWATVRWGVGVGFPFPEEHGIQFDGIIIRPVDHKDNKNDILKLLEIAEAGPIFFSGRDFPSGLEGYSVQREYSIES